MRLHYIQHEKHEDPGLILSWARKNGHELSRTLVDQGDDLPSLDTFELLVVMGGSMSVYEDDKYPWLAAEKRFIDKSIVAGKKVLGICLGAQILAHVLGAHVRQNSHKEIGWFEVRRLPEAEHSSHFRSFPEKFMTFHWHGDTFEIPEGCVRTFSSDCTVNQGFEYGKKVAGLQFHPEVSKGVIERYISEGNGDLKKGRFVQSAGEIMSGISNIPANKKLLFACLDSMAH
jgi:GMP synthase-like glutamine amidotransferase